MVLSLCLKEAIGAQQPTVPARAQAPSTVIQFKLLGAANNPVVVGENLQPGRVNYFIGNDPAKWQRNIPTYARVRYKNVYPGIDLVYYGHHRQLEFDFALSPGADPNLIQFEITGANRLWLDAQGDLALATNSGVLSFRSPVLYQQSGNQSVPISGSYVMRDSHHIAFRVAPYDSGKPLVIDPVLVYSTYLGGSDNDQATGIAVDSAGNTYIAGYSYSTDFPLAMIGSQATGQPHVFVSKFDATGSNVLFTDYIGGNSQDFGFALALDSANEIYVTGSTASSNFPVVHPYQGTYPGSNNAFLTRISADGSSLLYSTYLGGNGSDVPASLVIDKGGSAIVAGSTSSTNFPVANAYQPTAAANQGGFLGTYGFLTKFSPDGSSLIYSTYFGGNSNVPYNCGGTPCWGSPDSAIAGIALDNSGNVITAGNTNTYNFPTTPGAYLTTNSTQQNSTVGFVSKFGGSGNLGYSTYFYDSSGILTSISAVAADQSGAAYVTGIDIGSGTFPITSTTICDPSVYGFGCNYAFVTKFDQSGSTLQYSTFLGPNNVAFPQAIVLDANDDAYVLASTTSNSYSIVNGIEGYSNANDLLLAEIDPLATTQIFSTFIGGSGNDLPGGLAIDTVGNIYVAGTTGSADFPVMQGAFQDQLAGGTDAFVLKIAPPSAPAVALSPSLLQYSQEAVGSTSTTQTVLLRNMGSAQLSISSITTNGDFAETDTCVTSVPAAGSCTFSVTFTPTTPGLRTGSVVIQDDAAGSPHFIALSGLGSGPTAGFAPATLNFPGQPIGTTSAAKSVTLTNSGNMPLNITGFQATTSFNQSNNCPASLAAGSNCQIQVTFAPTATGSVHGTLTISDSAAGNPQTVTLIGNGSDFGLTSNSGSQTVKAGSAAQYQLTLSPIGGSFPNAISLNCSGLPSQTSCKFSAGSVTPGANPASSSLTITTTGSSARNALEGTSGNFVTCAWIQLSAMGLLGIMLIAPKRRARAGVFFLPLLLALIFTIGCGGTGIVPPRQTGTPTGTYTVTITAISGGLQHSLPLTLTVQ